MHTRKHMHAKKATQTCVPTHFLTLVILIILVISRGSLNTSFLRYPSFISELGADM